MTSTYFERRSPTRFLATEHVGGAWDTSEQHIAPSLGLIGHCIELDRDERRDDSLPLARLSYDILGTVPLGEVDVNVRLLRPGRTIELVEATMSYADKDIVVVRAWLMAGYDTSDLQASPLPDIAGPAEVEPYDMTHEWPGGFIRSVEVRRSQCERGRAVSWVTTSTPLIDEPFSQTARMLGLLDIANGLTPRVSPRDVAFPNVDLTVHLFNQPTGEWVGFDTAVSFGPGGLGLTHSVLHDESGPLGTIDQCLTVRPGATK